jgi:hypothetical protein
MQRQRRGRLAQQAQHVLQQQQQQPQQSLAVEGKMHVSPGP